MTPSRSRGNLRGLRERVRLTFQALERSAPILPLIPGVPGRRTHDYVRNGTTNLYAPLDVAPGDVITDISPRHRAEEFRDFQPDRQLGAGAPGQDVALDSSCTHKTPIDPALAAAPAASRCTSPYLQPVAEPSRAVVCRVDRQVDQTRRPSLDQRPGRLDPHLDQQTGTRTPSHTSGTRQLTRSSPASLPTSTNF